MLCFKWCIKCQLCRLQSNSSLCFLWLQSGVQTTTLWIESPTCWMVLYKSLDLLVVIIGHSGNRPVSGYAIPASCDFRIFCFSSHSCLFTYVHFYIISCDFMYGINCWLLSVKNCRKSLRSIIQLHIINVERSRGLSQINAMYNCELRPWLLKYHSLVWIPQVPWMVTDLKTNNIPETFLKEVR